LDRFLKPFRARVGHSELAKAAERPEFAIRQRKPIVGENRTIHRPKIKR
jgi:hypothetical protein